MRWMLLDMIIVNTESGSKYLINEDSKTFMRMPEENSLYGDGDIQDYQGILSLKVGAPMEILWAIDGVDKIRLTTNVTSIERI